MGKIQMKPFFNTVISAHNCQSFILIRQGQCFLYKSIKSKPEFIIDTNQHGGIYGEMTSDATIALVYSIRDANAYLLDLIRKNVLWSIKGSYAISCGGIFSSNSISAFIGNSDKKEVYVYSIGKNEEIFRIVNAEAFFSSPDNKYCLIVSKRKYYVCVKDPERLARSIKCASLFVILPIVYNYITCVCFFDDYVALSECGGSFFLYSIPQKKLLWEYVPENGFHITRAIYNPKEDCLFAFELDCEDNHGGNRILKFDYNTGEHKYLWCGDALHLGESFIDSGNYFICRDYTAIATMAKNNSNRSRILQ